LQNYEKICNFAKYGKEMLEIVAEKLLNSKKYRNFVADKNKKP